MNVRIAYAKCLPKTRFESYPFFSNRIVVFLQKNVII